METISRIYRIEPGEIAYLRVTVESYDGMAVVSTIDPHEALVELKISPGCEGLISQLLKDLAEEEGMGLIPILGSTACADHGSLPHGGSDRDGAPARRRERRKDGPL